MQQTSSIDIKVKLKEKDLEDFYAHLAKRSIGMKMVIAFSIIVFVAQLIRIVVEPQALESGLMWIIFVIFLFLLMLYSYKYSARKAFKNNKRIQAEYEYKIDEQNIRVKGEKSTMTIPWTDLYKVSESKTNLFFWLNKKQAQIVPKRYLSADELEVIRLLKKFTKK